MLTERGPIQKGARGVVVISPNGKKITVSAAKKEEFCYRF